MCEDHVPWTEVGEPSPHSVRTLFDGRSWMNRAPTLWGPCTMDGGGWTEPPLCEDYVPFTEVGKRGPYSARSMVHGWRSVYRMNYRFCLAFHLAQLLWGNCVHTLEFHKSHSGKTHETFLTFCDTEVCTS